MLREFLRWWGAQLTELLPRPLRRSPPTRADATVVTPLGALGQPIDAVAIALRRNGREGVLGSFPLAASGISTIPRSAARPPVLRLRGTDVLAKTVALPLAAERELDQVLVFEMDRETPFRADEVYWNHRVDAVDRQNAKLLVRLVLVPKAQLEPLIQPLAAAGLGPVRAEIADGPDAGEWLPLDGDGHAIDRAAAQLLRPLAAACAVLALAAVVTPFVRQSIATARLDQALAAGRAGAAEADRLHAEIAKLVGSADLVGKERAKVGDPLTVLAATTRIIPDDSYLTELQLRDRKLTLSGRSAAAARLIGAMAADSIFRNPTFSAPVTRIEALRQEIFTITTEIAP